MKADDFNGKLFIKFFLLCPSGTKERHLHDRHIAITKKFLHIEANVLFPILLIEVNERERERAQLIVGNSVVVLPLLCCSVLVFRGWVNEDDFSHTVSGESREKMIVRGYSKRVTAFWFCVAVEFSN